MSFGVLTLVLAARYGRHRVAPGGHTPRASLIVAALGFFAFLYSDIYYSSWFVETSANDTLAAALSGLAYGAIAAALVVAAVLLLGPVLRLVGVAICLAAVGVCQGLLNGVSLTADQRITMDALEAAAGLGVAVTLLVTILLRPSQSTAPLRFGVGWPGAVGSAAPLPYPATAGFLAVGVTVPQPGWETAAQPVAGQGRVPPRVCSGCGAGLSAGARSALDAATPSERATIALVTSRSSAGAVVGPRAGASVGRCRYVLHTMRDQERRYRRVLFVVRRAGDGAQHAQRGAKHPDGTGLRGPGLRDAATPPASRLRCHALSGTGPRARLDQRDGRSRR